MDVQIGDDTLTKTPSVIEELAYRDTWGKGADSFIAMIYERLSLMRDLLADDGSIYVHCDYRVSSYMRLVLDEVFGNNNFRNEIIWYYETYQGTVKNYYPRKHDTIFFYTKSDNYNFSLQHAGNPEDSINFKRWENYIVDGNKIMGSNYPKTDSRFTIRLDKWIRDNGREPNDDDVIFEVQTMAANSVWKDIKPVDPKDLSQKLDYPTQKPEALIERIIKSSTVEGDIVADFFMGSGTILAVAEKLGRKWIGSDLGKFSINTSRKRLIGVQRQLKAENKPYRAFEILNLGKYERQYYIGQHIDKRVANAAELESQRERAFVELITRAYQAEAVEGFRTFVAKKNARLVAVGPVNVPVSRGFVDEVIKECREKQITKVDILAFDFELGMGDNARDEAASFAIDLTLKYIPQDVFDKRAIEKNQVKFHDVSYIEVKPIIKSSGKLKTLAIELTDFSVHYNQDANITLKPGQTKTIVRDGQVLKISKDKESEIESQELLTKHWSDWVDYWSIDFDYESKKEIIRVPIIEPEQVDLTGETAENKLALEHYEEQWTGSYVFENEWQSFRTKKDRSLELTCIEREMTPGKRYKIAIKVVDIFGNDTMKVIEVQL